MLHHTENKTTVKIGQAIATVIADTVSPEGKRITTFELVYPRYIHSELMTHRVFSRNASSSRATPLKVTLDEVRHDPVFFDFVGKNQSGMVAGEELTDKELKEFHDLWVELGNKVANYVEYMSNNLGIHKQTLNRALEPWLRIRTLVTATEWDNFFKLRLAKDAQPEIYSLAQAMKKAMNKSVPKEDTLHVPYVSKSELLDEEVGTLDWVKVGVARCARVSYARHDGKESDISEDIKLHNRLLEGGHFSPFEHIARARKGQWANFDGWRSYRSGLGK